MLFITHHNFMRCTDKKVQAHSFTAVSRKIGLQKDEYHACKRALQKEVEQKSPAASADYDAAELAEANAMLVKMLRASKAAAEKQSPTVEEIAPPAK